MKPLYWIDSQNFGDALNPFLYKAITGKEAKLPNHMLTHVVFGIGSIIHLAKPNDMVWGTGCMGEHLPPQCDHTTQVLAVRGPLTAWLLHKNGVPVPKIWADPAILVPKYFTFEKSNHKQPSVIIPHYVDYEVVDRLEWDRDEYDLVSVTAGVVTVMNAIATSKAVITSSLHALIVAEAYGVPAIWVEFSYGVTGSGFKFWDYYLSTFRVPPDPLDFRKEIDPDAIENALADYVFPKWDYEKLRNRLLYSCPFV